MQRLNGQIVYSASDLNAYLDCRHLTQLESLVARGELKRPDREDRQAQLLRRKGDEHEHAHLEALRSIHGAELAEFARPESSIEAYHQAEAATLTALRRGVPVIYQATFFDGRFIGHADFLRRVPEPSDLGDFSYEAVDTKLALNPKPYYLVQLCNYSEHLERLQGRLPHFAHVLLGSGEERRFRLSDYMAYYRRLKQRFLDFAGEFENARVHEPSEYPFECSHCKSCPWNDRCEAQRRDDDHLSLIAWARRDQIAKLETSQIARVATLAASSDEHRPTGMSPQTFAKLRRQARLQVRGRQERRPIYELLPHDPGLGFELLPRPAQGDVFFDMEGDPLYEPTRGLEYLFGCWLPDDEQQFQRFWGLDRAREKRAFEEFIDFIVERRKRYPGLHVYHFASYEKDALRRLAQQHSTRENEVDDLLRGEVLVDLFAVVRRAIAISEERYGLKNLERFYQLERATEVKKGDESIVMFETWLQERDDRILDDIERYNRDDCLSTYRLRQWLLELRLEAMQTFGIDLPLRAPKSPEEPCHAQFIEGCSKCVKRRDDEREESRRSELERKLLPAVPPVTEAEYRGMPLQGRMRYLLANLLAYHRREEKPAWWAYYDRCENVDQLLEFDRDSIGGLKLRDDIAPLREKLSFVYTYEFPDQLHKLSAGDDPVNPRTKRKAGTIVSLDHDSNRLELKTKASPEAARAITELIPPGPPKSTEQRKALARIAAAFLDGTLQQQNPATYDLLAARDPRLTNSVSLTCVEGVQPEHITAQSVSAVVAALDRSYLCVQGPPGSGKSTIGSKVICDLLVAGKRVAVTSMSHKAIHNLLQKVEACMLERGGTFRGLYKHSDGNAGSAYSPAIAAPFIESVGSNDPFAAEDYQLAGGTGWLCAREELGGKFDYLFIDEAGQVSLADALAMSACAKNVVLLGDPSQLAQVSQGRHPIHADDSVLQHLLGEEQTIPKHRGIFLDVSYRMQPAICEFISAAMYEERLRPAPETKLHRITAGEREYAGLYFVGLDHVGNSSQSLEEAGEIVRQISLLLHDGELVDSAPPNARFPRRVQARDLIVVTPYNAQRRLILDKLRDAGIDVDPDTGVRVGTVDKFQGQEAAIVFYSMATSSGEDVPRNVEFLFERNRFNVAISRARTASVLLCSPRLLDIRCRTPEQMALANLLCAFEERTESLYTAKATVVP
ncbi:MAG: TM0106 family RecB-like putative nuclease [Candidatus Eremiobacteraeota bacterium]|nr:TM0106 family RecB-like putative nuclease [Candidatus Eremiobacteraeota bacterium]